jgi:hypothetical protein
MPILRSVNETGATASRQGRLDVSRRHAPQRRRCPIAEYPPASTPWMPALSYMRNRALAGPVIAHLVAHPDKQHMTAADAKRGLLTKEVTLRV